jgi:hypothetical protein
MIHAGALLISITLPNLLDIVEVSANYACHRCHSRKHPAVNHEYDGGEQWGVEWKSLVWQSNVRSAVL